VTGPSAASVTTPVTQTVKPTLNSRTLIRSASLLDASRRLIFLPKQFARKPGAIPDADLKADASPVTQGRFTATKTTLKAQLAALG